MPSTDETISPGQGVLGDARLRIIFGITLTAIMGVAPITPAFPKIADSLGIAPEDAGLLITFYYLSGVGLTPVLGFLSDRIGRKRILVPSLFLFGVAGSACALVRDFEWLLALRFLQGVGAAALGSLNLTLIGDIFEGKRRVAAMGYNASVLSVGTASYPAIGGFLAAIAWYWPFALPIVAVPVGLFVLFKLDHPEPVADQPIGEYLRGVAAGLRDRRVIGAFIIALAVFAVLFGPYLTFFPLLLDDAFGAAPWKIGLVMSSAAVASGLTSLNLERLITRFSSLQIIIASFVFYVGSLAAMVGVDGLWWMTVPAAGFGVAQGLNIPSLQSLIATIAPTEHRGAFMALNGTVYRVGQTTGPVVFGLVYGLGSFAAVFYGAAALMGALTVVAVVTLRARGRAPSDGERVRK